MMTKQTPKADAPTPNLRERANEAYSDARERAIEAYDSARERASEAGTKAKRSIGETPLIALGGGLAIGAIVAALIPKTKAEDKLLGSVGQRITGGAKAAAEAAREAGREKLSDLNITRDAGASAVQSLIQGLGDAARSSGEAALGAIRQKD